MKNKKMIVILIAIVILIIAGIWAKGFLSVDSCLDSGGHWSAEAKKCEH
jgi:flagellar basal body-associated protein FliL